MKKYTRVLSMIMCIVLMFTEFQIYGIKVNAEDDITLSEDAIVCVEEEIIISENSMETEADDTLEWCDEMDDPEWYKYNGLDMTESTEDDEIIVEPDADGKVLKGIDVSKWQGDINWGAVKAAGIQFAIIRCGARGSSSGSISTDSKYKQNIERAINAGIPVGVYFYSQAITEEEAIQEADYAISLVRGYKISLPVVLDYEYDEKKEGRLYKAYLSKEAATNVCLAFCKEVRSKGYEPMVYANKSMLESSLNASTIAANNKIWLAQYNSQVTYSGAYNFWQYTSKGSVNGINGKVDMNYWYPASHSVTYECNGGSNNPSNPTMYYEGEDTPLYAPTKEGYMFAGWHTDSELKKRISSITPDLRGNLKLYAKWELDGYYIKYDANAVPLNRKATGKTDKSVVIFGNKNTTTKKNGFKVSGYKFIGWNTRSDGSGKAFKAEEKIGTYFEDKNIAKNRGDEVTLYAQWEGIPREVTFVVNDGKRNTEKVVTCLCGDKIKDLVDLKSAEWDRPGYVVSGWALNPEGKGKKYNEVTEAMFGKNSSTVTLYAQWKLNKYKISYNLDGGKNNKKNPKKYQTDTETITLLEPTKKGHTFVKWIREEDSISQNAVASIEKGSYGDIKLKAVWRENVYKINYHVTDKEYTTLSENVITVSYNYTGLVNMAKVMGAITIKDEYKDTKGIVAWTTKENGKGKNYKLIKPYKSLLKDDGAELDLYSKWGGASYEIKYLLDGADYTSKLPLSYSYNTKKTVKIKKPTRVGYIFTGWKLVSGNAAAFDESASVIVKGATGHITLAASWEAVKYTVNFNLNTKDKNIVANGSLTVTDILYGSSENTEIRPDITIPEYYKLKGWSTKPNGKGLTVSPNQIIINESISENKVTVTETVITETIVSGNKIVSENKVEKEVTVKKTIQEIEIDPIGKVDISRLCKKNNGKVTLYAIWEPVQYNITYVNIDPDNPDLELKNVTNKNGESYKYSYNKDKKLVDPIKYGFVFKGWYSDKECKTKVTSIKKGTYGDITLYGKWGIK